ncbi:hypothetical protein KAI92_03875 [Candidatus Parcubacteria bacterium]|nr:hypothetical protein [Candidatus Parcubacteria bacterium]
MNTILDPFEKYKNEYMKADKFRKGEILDTVVDLTKMHKKSIIRKFRSLQLKSEVDKQVRLIKPGRPCIYDRETTFALKKLWILSKKLCGELLHPMISEYIDQYKKFGNWEYSSKVDNKLCIMSVSTIKRKTNTFFKDDKDSFRKGVSTTKSSAIKTIIPIRDTSWFEAKIGEGQLDTVVHCGNVLSGDMAYTLNFTDYQTYWIGLRAQMNKGQKATQESLFYLKDYLPFKMISIHPDTGSEFINYHLKTSCDNIGVEMSRSRPNHKNDNMCVEERNGHVVRKYIGYIRIDCQEAVDALNEYYDALCLFSNHFIAIRRTKEKERVGARYKRKFEKARTPYQRVVESSEISNKKNQN